MFKSLKDILPGTIDELGISEELKRAAVFAAWRTVAARLPAHARAARPLRFQHGTLVVEAPSSAAIHELHMRAPQLTRDVNKIVGRLLVTKLDFRVRGQRSANRAATSTLPQTATEMPRNQPAPEDPERERRLRQAIDLIENPAVRRQALARLTASEVQEPHRCTACGTEVSNPGLCPLCQAHEDRESGE